MPQHDLGWHGPCCGSAAATETPIRDTRPDMAGVSNALERGFFSRLLDRGEPRDEDTEGGIQPADKSLINRRLQAPPPALCSSAHLPVATAACRWVDKPPTGARYLPRTARYEQTRPLQLQP